MLYPDGRYNLNFDISAALLALVLFIIFLAKKDKTRICSRLYCACCVLLFLSSSNEVVALIMRNRPEYFHYPLGVATNLVAHFTQNLVPYVFAMYVIFYIGADHYLRKRDLVLLSLPAAALGILLLVPPLRSLVYQLGTDGSFAHAALYPYVFIQDLFYVVLAATLIFAWRRSLERQQLVFFVLAVLAGVVMLILTLEWPYLRATNFLESLLCLVAFHMVETHEETIDKIAGLPNYMSFRNDSRFLFGRDNKSSLITVKVQTPNYYRMTYGHENTDTLLAGIGQYFLGLPIEHSNTYYLGDGIFVVVLYGDREDEARTLSEQINARFQEHWKIGKLDVLVPSEVWLSFLPENIRSQEQLLMSVEMPANPSHRKGSVHIADEFGSEQRKIAVNKAITAGLRSHTFKVYYQPIYDTRARRIRTAEALVRLTDPELGAISPEEFIKIAEQTGQVNEIGMYVFREVCRFYSENHLDQLGVDFIEVNLSTVQCMDEHLTEKFQAILDEYHLEPKHIDLEITESALIHDREMMARTIRSLRKLGFTFALDDFGTGFSNYEYVITFPLSLIKIDKSILWAADKKRENDLVLTHAIQMGKDLNRGIVVEGVETKEQRDKLIDRGVEYLQGFLYSKAIDGPKFIQYVKAFNATA